MTMTAGIAEISFDEFYKKNYLLVYRYIKKKIFNAEDAEDLASVVFTYCFQNWERYDASKASLSSWLFMIVNSRLKNYYRDRKSFVDFDSLSFMIGENQDSLDQALELDDIRQALAEALKTLPEKHCQLVIYKYFMNLPDSEIAERLEMSSGNVRVTCHRVLKRLSQTMKGFE